MMVATFAAFAMGEFSEAMAVMLFYQIGELFQSYAAGKSRQSISDLTARADALAGLVETERTKRASLVGGALAPEGTVDTSVPPASATPCSDALDAIRSLDDRRAYAKAHAAEIAAERAAAARPRCRR